MGTKRRLLFASLPVLVLGALVWFLLFPHGPPEPVYEGKSLSYWLGRYEVTQGGGALSEEHARAENAVRHIGTNAIPTLLRWLHAKDSPFKIKLNALFFGKQDFTRTPFIPSVRRNYLAMLGFQILGAEGKSAVPELIKIFEENNSEILEWETAQSLGDIGPDAKPAIPVLIKNLTSTNISKQWAAIHALGRIHSDPEVVLPVLIQKLGVTYSVPGPANTRGYVIVALGEFGPEAKAAVPVILPSLNDPDPKISRQATDALKKIDPEAAAKAGIK